MSHRSSGNKPLVSVVMPTYNRAEVIERAIRSVIAQTYPAWELIVVDDASTDHTAEVVRSCGDSRVYYVRLPINCGHPSRPRNIGWTLARGVYIAYIDDDNAWRPRHLESLVAACEASPEAAGAYGDRCHHAPDGSTEDIVGPDHGVDTGDGMHRRDLAALMPEMWTESNFTNEDMEFWGRLRQRHPVGLVHVPEVLSDYYIHDGNRYSNHWLNFRRYDERYFKLHAPHLDSPARWRESLALLEALRPRRVLDVGCGRGWLVRALRQRGVEAWGVDPAPILRSLTVVPEAHLRAPADRLPFPDGAFDVVHCADVLAHIPEAFVMRSLRELLRVCGGTFVAAVDCADPTREGHSTIRPRSWWAERLAELGAQLIGPAGAGPTRRSDRLALLVCRVQRETLAEEHSTDVESDTRKRVPLKQSVLLERIAGASS